MGDKVDDSSLRKDVNLCAEKLIPVICISFIND